MSQAVPALFLFSPVLAVGGSWLLHDRLRRRWTRGLLATAVAVAAPWIVALVMMIAGYRDAENWIDCWPGCSTLQRVVGAALVWGGLGLLALAAAALLAWLFVPREPPGRQAKR